MADDKGTDRITERVVLERRVVLLLPDGVTQEQIDAAIKAGEFKRGAKLTDAWVECGTFEGVSKRQSIEAHAGKAGTPDALVGIFKAPSLTAWKGGLEHVAPAKPLVQGRLLED